MVNEKNMDARKVFEKLFEKGLLVSYEKDFKTSKMCLLKNTNDEIIFRFKLLEGKTLLESLKYRLERFEKDVNECF